MSKIIRTPSKVLGGITAEEKSALDAHAAKWIANAMSTAPVAPERLVPAIKALYAAAGLKEPRVVIAPSPLVMAFAGGFAAAIWWARKNGAKAVREGLAKATDSATRSATHSATDSATYSATYSATDSATRSATDSATYSATYSATRSATHSATHSATYSATDSATDSATYSATHSATRSATYSATDSATYSATRSATRSATDSATYSATRSATRSATDSAFEARRFASLAQDLGRQFGVDHIFMLRCAQNWYSMYQGGNMWSSWDCYLTAFRDVLGLVLPEHAKYRAWEACAVEGGFRVLHEEFCIVSDRPEVLKVDQENRPHCENGPSHRWRDGWSLYHWHGVSIPGEWVTGSPPSAKEALTWQNIEQRRAACEIVGWVRIMEQLDARVIDTHENDEIGSLLEVDLPDSGRERFLRVRCGTGRSFVLPVAPHCRTAKEANLWTYGLDSEDDLPEVRT